MHKILIIIIGIGSSLLFVACGSAPKNDSLEGKKAQLTALNGQQDKLANQISSLEAELGKSDSTGGAKEKAKLVALTALTPVSFTHYIDLQGDVEAENTSFISPRGSGGVVRQGYVKQGDHVNKGQILLKLDDAGQRLPLPNPQTHPAYPKNPTPPPQ